jgi:PD-(D/E)XK endonuclease
VVEMTTDQKGNIAEAAITLEAVKLDIGVYRPITEGERYDLILDIGFRLLRVQCKWAALHGEVLHVRCCSARRGAGARILNRPDTTDEVDAFAAYSVDLDQCFLLPPELWAERRLLHLRVTPTRNNQRRRINWARDFEFAARIRSFGAIAQLGERRRGTPKVTGSNPVGSISDRSRASTPKPMMSSPGVFS